MNEISKLIELLKDDKDYVDLVASNFLEFSIDNNLAIPKSLILKSIEDYFENHIYKPDSKGLISARNSISGYYQEYNLEVGPDEVIITASTSESYNQIFSNFTNPNEEILFPNPCYPLFEYLAAYSKVIPKFYRLDEVNKWKIDIESIRQSITKKTRGIVIISPNNPTGSIVTQEELDEIESIARDHNLFIIFDEVFSEFRTTEIFPRPFGKRGVDIFILNGISKMLSLPDLKLAWIVVLGRNKNKFINILETSNDTYLNANYLTQFIFPTLMPYRTSIAEQINILLNINRNSLQEIVRLNPKHFVSNIGNGGIHSILKINTDLNEENLVIKILKQKKISVHPGYFYDIESPKHYSHIVISLLKRPDIFKKALEELAEICTL